jgi:hypothetical protein
MTSTEPWSEDQFTRLLDDPSSSAEDIALQVGRSVGAVETVRAGLHAHHRGGDQSLLSAMMCRVIEQRQGAT